MSVGAFKNFTSYTQLLGFWSARLGCYFCVSGSYPYHGGDEQLFNKNKVVESSRKKKEEEDDGGGDDDYDNNIDII